MLVTISQFNLVVGISLVNLFKKWFTPLDEQNLEIKIKIIGVDQDYDSICYYECYGYWKLSSGYFWKKAGLIHKSELGRLVSKLTKNDYNKLMEMARNHVMDILKDNGPSRKDNITIISIPIKELDL